jgi:flagellar FliL protein
MGGFLYYLAHSGHLMARTSVVRGESAAQPTRLVALDPLLVNLADPGGEAYLRLSLALRIADAPAKKAGDARAVGGEEEETDAIRDTVLAVLGRQTSDSLLALDGKERLKSELRRTLAQRNPKLKVMDLFFTDFLVQR